MSISNEMYSFELPLPDVKSSAVAPAETENTISSSENLLLENVMWYCQLRWIIVAIFGIFGIVSFFPPILDYFGFKSNLLWPFLIAIVLTFVNIGFIIHIKIFKREGAIYSAKVTLWEQIIFDLLIITFVVHKIGSIETHISIIYLFHIVLSCIFLSRLQSCIVTLVACFLYVSCISLEVLAVLPSAGIYEDAALRKSMHSVNAGVLFIIIQSVVTWIIVWYLSSHLSSLVRKREYQLEDLNRHLLKMQKEKMQHMLLTTHELKAPFAAIQSNTQLLVKGYCGTLTDEANKVIRRISDRSKRLTNGIQEMLQLANLHSQTEKPPKKQNIDLETIIEWSINQIKQIALEYGVTLDVDLVNVEIAGVEDHLKILFTNLLSNAIFYSHRKGKIHVRSSIIDERKVMVSIEDHGIGIQEEKLPKIFDEYYRTNEAVRHNKNSTGLGLSIVRRISEMYYIKIKVESMPDVGTKFTLVFPD